MNGLNNVFVDVLIKVFDYKSVLHSYIVLADGLQRVKRVECLFMRSFIFFLLSFSTLKRYVWGEVKISRVNSLYN